MWHKEFLVFVLPILILTIFFVIPDSYGHGLGYEVLPPIDLGSKQVALEISSNPIPDSNAREISFTLFDTSNGVTINDVTFFVMATKQNQTLFDVTGQRDDGTFVIRLIPTESEQIITNEEDAGLFGSILDPNKIVNVYGNMFDSGGLYNFKVLITTAEGYTNFLSPPIDYDAGISFPDTTYYDIDDPNFGQQKLSIVTYYEQLKNDFNYNEQDRIISYSMPFDWSEENMKQVSVIHQELLIPKTFGDLMVKGFSAKVNGLDILDSNITVDDFSGENRIMHLVISQKEMLELSQKLQNSNEIKFDITPKDENLLSTITENGQFKINLSWEPKKIESGIKTTFIFDILDVFLLDKPVSVNYDLSIIYDEKKLLQKNGISTDLRTEHNTIEFLVPENVSGPMILQFENLDENELASASLPVIVNRIDTGEISIPAWIKNNAGWWANGEIPDSAFLQGIEFLIKEGIMVIPPTVSGDIESHEVPAWIKNNAGWWANGEIDDNTFVSGIQYLIKTGIIVV